MKFSNASKNIHIFELTFYIGGLELSVSASSRQTMKCIQKVHKSFAMIIDLIIKLLTDSLTADLLPTNNLKQLFPDRWTDKMNF